MFFREGGRKSKNPRKNNTWKQEPKKKKREKQERKERYSKAKSWKERKFQFLELILFLFNGDGPVDPIAKSYNSATHQPWSTAIAFFALRDSGKSVFSLDEMINKGANKKESSFRLYFVNSHLTSQLSTFL